MNEEFAGIKYAQIKEYRYARWFNEVQYNGKHFQNQNVKKLFLSLITQSHNTQKDFR